MEIEFVSKHCAPIILIVILIAIVAIHKYVNSLLHQWVRPLNINDRVHEKKIYETAIIAIFSNPSTSFNFENLVTVHLLHNSCFRFAELDFDLTQADTRSDYFCNRYFRLFYLITDTKKMPYITQIRATHESPNDTIFLEGFEVWELMWNSRTFYSVKESIRGGHEILRVPKITIKPQKLVFWSKHTFCPTFENSIVYDFGEDIFPIKERATTLTVNSEDINGVIIPSKLQWFETSIFYALLMAATYLTNVLIMTKSWGKLETFTGSETIVRIVAAVMFSGGIALLFTEIMASIFFFWLKSKYEESQSQSSKRSRLKREAINLNPFFEVSYLILMVFLTISGTFAGFLIRYSVESKDLLTRSLRFQPFSDEVIDENIVTSIIYLSSLLLSIIIWLPVLGCVRYIIHYLTFTPKTLDESIVSSDIPEVIETFAKRPELRGVKRFKHSKTRTSKKVNKHKKLLT